MTAENAVEILREPWGSMTWLVEDGIVEGAGLSLMRMTLNPGATSPRHRHPDCNEVITLLQGRIEAHLDGRVSAMAPDAHIFIRAGTPHHIANPGSEEAVMLICYSSGTRIYELVPG